MNDDLKNSQNDAPCEQCKQAPCVCDNEDMPSKAANQKPRTKGSHRSGNPPKLKWI